MLHEITFILHTLVMHRAFNIDETAFSAFSSSRKSVLQDVCKAVRLQCQCKH